MTGMANYSGSHDYVDGTLSTTSDEDGTPTLSGLMAMLLGVDANDRGGIVLAGSLFERSIDASLNGLLDVVMELSVSNVTLSNVDSLGAVRLTAPVMGRGDERPRQRVSIPPKQNDSSGTNAM